MQMMKSIFRGVGQVMFQGNALSGALMLAGIACNSLLMCLFALAGSAIGTCTACLLYTSTLSQEVLLKLMDEVLCQL